MRFDYDLIVIGGGAAGFVSAKLAAGLGKKVALIEKGRLGGECTNYGCVPSKTLIRSANSRFHARGIGDLTTAAASVAVMDHVRSIVKRVFDGHGAEVFERLGIRVLFGEPRFLDNHTLDVSGTTLNAKRFIVSTGSSPFIPSIDGIDTVPFLTNDNVWDLDRLPSSMLILGGGPIGTELAQAFARLGTEITIVEMGEQIMIREDKDLRDRLAGRLAGEGVTIRTGTKAVSVARENGKIALTVEDKDRNRGPLMADSILVAVGRKANVDGLGLDQAGVTYSQKGIAVDEQLRTSAPNIYACGDVAGPYQFSHMAEYQARIAAQNAVLPVKRRASYDHYIWCTFTDPELAHAGLTEEEARARLGDRLRVYTWQYGDTDRGKTDGEEFGMAKFLCDDRYRLLGAHILGPRAGELIHEAQILKTFGMPFYKLDSVIHVYPTFTDVVKQPAKLCYIDKVRSTWYVKLASALFGRRKPGV
jgi:pyruvate/2-oxoglutarate dehydrogenase complex dihydrolipoamide dehydrogenase (E3) component